MLQPKPYFLENSEWYYHDKKKNRYFLTDKAPKEEVESYNQFYGENDVDLGFYAVAMHDAEMSYREGLKADGKSQEEIDRIIKEWLEG